MKTNKKSHISKRRKSFSPSDRISEVRIYIFGKNARNEKTKYQILKPHVPLKSLYTSFKDPVVRYPRFSLKEGTAIRRHAGVARQ